jgi:hypothetical protein
MIELLLKGKLIKEPASLMKLFGPEVKRFTSFLGLLVFSYKGSLCLMRRHFESERLNTFIAGSISALPLALLDSKSMRTLISLYMLVRAFEGLYKKSVEKGWLPQLPAWLLYQFTYTTLNYGITFRVDAVNPSYLKIARYFMCTTENESMMLDAFSKYYETIGAQAKLTSQ